EPHARPIWVRVNNDADLDADLEAVCIPGLAGICLPKADTDSLDRLDRLLAARERHLRTVPLPVMALIETAIGVYSALSVAQHTRVRVLAVGEQDLAAELGVPAPSTLDE